MVTAWALYLELSPVLIGVLGALPFAAQLVQLPASWLTRRLGSRCATLWTIALSRQAILPLAFLPFAPLSLTSKQALFLACTLASSVLAVAGNNAWTSWMGDLVPGLLRGRYFGRRSALCAFAAASFSLGAGVTLDRARTFGHAGAALCALTLVASIAGAVTTVLLRRQHHPTRAAAPEQVRLHEALAPLRDWRARRLLAFQGAWSAASGVAAAFYPLHMIGNLHLGFARMALYAAGVAGFRMLSSPLWGGALDRRGARPVLACCSVLLSISPLFWLAATETWLWPLAIDAAVCGIANAGLSLATFSLPISLSGPRERSFYVGLLAAVGGAAAGLGSAAGGALVHVLPDAWSLFGCALVSSHALFLAGAIARFGASFLALRVVERPMGEVVPLHERRTQVRARLSA
jgi:MFS family permease